jgi:hypothetical protein
VQCLCGANNIKIVTEDKQFGVVGLDVEEKQLHGPVAEIKLSQQFGTLGLCVQQSGDQYQFSLPKTLQRHNNLNQADVEFGS